MNANGSIAKNDCNYEIVEKNKVIGNQIIHIIEKTPKLNETEYNILKDNIENEITKIFINNN